jgi:HrpA-like RNA helicase
MPGEYTVICKDCMKTFTYDDAYLEVIAARGGARPERCTECRAAHGVEIGKVGMPFFTLRPIGGRAPVLTGGGLGMVFNGERAHVFSPTKPAIDAERKKFAAGDEEIEALFRALRDHQIAIVEGPTGSGKSTYLPYRLVAPTVDMARHWSPRGQVVVTQPRIRAAHAIVEYVANLLGVGVGPGKMVGVRTGENRTGRDPHNRLAYVTDGTLLNWIASGEAEELGAIMIDEAHERSVTIDLILMLHRRLLPRMPHLRLIIASATIDIARFQNFFGGAVVAPHIKFSAGETKGYECHYRANDPRVPKLPYGSDAEIRELVRQAPLALAEKMVEVALAPKPSDDIPDDILGFMPTVALVEETVGHIERVVRGHPQLRHVRPMPLHANLSPAAQRAATGKKTNLSLRRLVVATNIAETSLTIEGLGFVVDSGLILEKEWNSRAAANEYRVRLHSQAGCRQRWGRVGRYARGVVHTLYTEEQFQTFPAFTEAQILRSSAEEIILKSRAAGINPETLVWLDEPDPAEQARARGALVARGALTTTGEITDRGLELSMAEPTQQQLLITADTLACAVEMGAVLALLSRRTRGGPFLRDPGWNAAARRAARRAHAALRAACVDDVDLYLKLVVGWSGEYGLPGGDAWAVRHFIDATFLGERLEQERWQMIAALARNKREDERRPVDPRLAGRLRLAFAASLPDRIFTHQGRGYLGKGDDVRSQPLRLDRVSVLNGREGDAHRVVLPNVTVRAGRRGAPFAARLDPEWAEIATEQPLLALQAARYARTEGHAQAAMERLLIDLRLPPGSRVRCRIKDLPDAEGSSPVELVSLLEEPPSPRAGRRRAPAREGDESGAEGDTVTDLVAGRLREETGYDESFVGELAADEVDPEPDSAEVASSGDPGRHAVSNPPLPPLSRYPGRLRGEAPPPGWEIVAEVTGYDLAADPPAVLLRPSSDPPPPVLFRRIVGDVAEITATVDAVDRDDDPSLNGLVVIHTPSQLELVLDPEDVSLSGRGELLEEISSGVSLSLVALLSGPEVAATALPAAVADLAGHLNTGVAETTARVLAIEAGRRVWFRLGISRPEAGLMHAAVAEADRLPRPPGAFEPGDELTCRIDPSQRTVRVDLPVLPAGVASGDLPPGMRFAGGERVLTQTGALAASDWRTLIARSTNPAFRAAVTELLRLSNLPALTVWDGIRVELARRYPRGSRLRVRVAEHRRNGVIVEAPGGGRVFVPRDELAWEPDPIARTFGDPGAELDAVVTESDPTRATFALTLKLPENDPLNRFRALRPDEPVQAWVNNVDGQAVWISLGGGVKGRIPATMLRRLGNSDPLTAYRDGEEITVYVLGIHDEAKRHLTLSLRPGGPVRLAVAPTPVAPARDLSIEGAIKAVVPQVTVIASIDYDGQVAMALVAAIGPCLARREAINKAFGGRTIHLVQRQTSEAETLHGALSRRAPNKFGGSDDPVVAVRQHGEVMQVTVRRNMAGRLIGPGGRNIRALERLMSLRINIKEEP